MLVHSRDATGKFPDYPDEEEGGSAAIFKKREEPKVLFWYCHAAIHFIHPCVTPFCLVGHGGIALWLVRDFVHMLWSL